MNEQEITDLFLEFESDIVERKASIADKDRICQAVCAFANDLPNNRRSGVIFIGVNDNGTCAQLPITDQLLLELAHLRSDGNILPFPAMVVEKKIIKECDLAVILVQPSYAPPVRYKGQTWIRVGPRRAIATLEEERRLAEKRRAEDLPFDLRPVLSGALVDLDLDLFNRNYLPSTIPQDILKLNQRSEEEQLASLRFATAEQNPKPTVAGILIIGKEPTKFLPGAYVQFLRIDGKELTKPIKNQKEIRGPLIESLRILHEILEVNNGVATDITTGARETHRPDYPIVALWQLALNAILHRTYEGTNAPVRITWFNDRIEIQNPGGPFGQVHRENFGQPGITDYRNPHLAEAMKNLGYVQRFGIGIQLARMEMKNNGNPAPQFIVEESHIAVILQKRI